MKNTLIITTALILLTGTACNSKKASTQASTAKEEGTNFSPLKDRNERLAKLADWPIVQQKVKDLFVKIKADSTDLKSKLLLAQVYMQEARVTGEHPYYYPASLTIIDDVIRHDNKDFVAHTFKASVLLSLHHFKEALEVGTVAMNLNSSNSYIYGVLCDANVELGNYDEAVKMSDKMQTLRPGLEAYSRASYLREIYGDNTGAIKAMKMAFDAGLPGSEEASWAGNTLSHLYENTGDLKKAKEISQIVLVQRPSYAFATEAMGKIEMAQGNYDKAIVYFDSAIAIIPEVSFYENKAKALKKKGETAKANEVYNTVIKMLQEDAQSGHYVEMELAIIYMELNDLENAAKFAKIEYDRRPNNIDVNNTMAWVLYNKGNYAEAKKHMEKATRMGTQNAELLARAAAIEKALGNDKGYAEYNSKSKSVNPNFSLGKS